LDRYELLYSKLLKIQSGALENEGDPHRLRCRLKKLLGKMKLYAGKLIVALMIGVIVIAFKAVLSADK
jgi:hypothetical protein